MNCREQLKVAIMLAQGFTKKEIACRLNKSVFTVNEHTRRIYEKTGSRNLADITRWVISRYTGKEIDNILVNAFHDLFVAAAVIGICYLAVHPDATRQLINAAGSILDALKK